MARVLRRKIKGRSAAEASMRATDGGACLVGGPELATAATVIDLFDAVAAAAAGGEDEVGVAGVDIVLPTDLLGPMPLPTLPTDGGYAPPPQTTSTTELSGAEVAVALTPRVAMPVEQDQESRPPPPPPLEPHPEGLSFEVDHMRREINELQVSRSSMLDGAALQAAEQRRAAPKRFRAEGAALADARRRQVAEAAALRRQKSKSEAGGASAEMDAMGWLAGKLGGCKTPTDRLSGVESSGLITPVDLEARGAASDGSGAGGATAEPGAQESNLMKRSSSHTMWMQHFLEAGSTPQAAIPRGRPPPLEDALGVRPMSSTAGQLRPTTPGVCAALPGARSLSGGVADSTATANVAAMARTRGVLSVAQSSS